MMTYRKFRRVQNNRSQRLTVRRQLSAGALDALKEFYNDRDTRRKAFEDVKAQAEDEFDASKPLSMEAFTEDWNASQFWYNDNTATKLAKQLLEGATKNSHIAVISAPSAFLQLKNLLASQPQESRPHLTLLEFDDRFGVFKEFVKYDFEQPIKLPTELKGKFDAIICDPPFLSEDCQTKAALTIRWLAKNWASTSNPSATGGISSLRLIVCTGERMESLIHKLYSKVNVRTTSFEVVHAKGLSNEFRCYANFQSEIWTLL
jgi:16S rRNA G966 N2-methylase RsmD